MAKYREALFVHPRFSPGELERITGLTPVAVRDWRRRGLIHPSLADKGEDGRFHFMTAAEFMLLKRLSDHGIGPKQVYGWSSSYSVHLARHALNNPSAWDSQEAWSEWQRLERYKPLKLRRFWVIRTAPGGFDMTDDPLCALIASNGVGTIVDFEALGGELREACGLGANTVKWTIWDPGQDIVFEPNSSWQPVPDSSDEGTPTE